MKAFFLTGSAALLLACGVTVFPASIVRDVKFFSMIPVSFAAVDVSQVVSAEIVTAPSAPVPKYLWKTVDVTQSP